MLARNRSAGFTLIEVLVTVSIFAILVALTVPAMKAWVANTKVRTVADSLENGIRLAQSEAERLSRQVVFALTNDNPPAINFTAVTSGPYWAIQTVPLPGTGEAPTLIASGVLSSAGTVVNIAAGSANQTALCFNSLGRLAFNATPGPGGATCTPPTAPVAANNTNNTQPMFTYTVSVAGADHTLEVEVATGGQLHLCDTSQTSTAANPNPYAC